MEFRLFPHIFGNGRGTEKKNQSYEDFRKMRRRAAGFTALAIYFLWGLATVCAQNGPPDSLTLANGEALTGKVRLITLSTGNHYIKFNDQKRYELKEIKSFTNHQQYFITLKTLHVINKKPIFETLLLRRIVRGDIEVYSEVKNNPENLGSPSYDYFRKLNGTPQKFNYNNLAEALKDRPDSYKVIKKGKRLRKIGTGLLFSSIVLMTVGVAQSFPSKPPEIVGFKITTVDNRSFFTRNKAFIGAGVALAASLPMLLSANNLIKAVKLYNKK